MRNPKASSSDELSAFLTYMTRVQTFAANDEYNYNMIKRLNDVVNSLENLKVEMRYMNLSLLNVHSKTEQLNTTLIKVVNDRMSRRAKRRAGLIFWLKFGIFFSKEIHNKCFKQSY
jgi:hypothetical protein